MLTTKLFRNRDLGNKSPFLDRIQFEMQSGFPRIFLGSVLNQNFHAIRF